LNLASRFILGILPYTVGTKRCGGRVDEHDVFTFRHYLTDFFLHRAPKERGFFFVLRQTDYGMKPGGSVLVH